MRPEREYRAALRLIENGRDDTAVARELGIPRTTVRAWRAGLVAGRGGRTKWTSAAARRRTGCLRCGDDWVDEEAYAYLLGMYLGDGCLSLHPRGVHRLRVSCDLKYPEIINEVATHMVVVRGKDSVGFVTFSGWVEVYSYWRHWVCLFPQHGPGRKHERSIVLADWQQIIVGSHPKALVRGLIQSDGSRHINPVTRPTRAGIRKYRYSRYMFTNASTDILGILTGGLDLLGVHWTQTTSRVVSVARRQDVAFLDTFVGPKR